VDRFTSGQRDQSVGVSGGDRVPDRVVQKGESDRSSLGNTARIASTVSPSQIPSPAITAKKRRYKLQNLARKLLPDERIRTCHRDTIPTKQTVEVICNLDTNTAGFQNLQTCNSVWACPVCAAKISEQRRRELQIATANIVYKTVLITYTLRHRNFHTLAQSLNALKAARRALKAGRWFQDITDDYGWVGSVSSYEVTWSPRNGWHPHAHELVLLPANISPVDLGALEFRLKRQWSKVLAVEGFTAEFEHGLDVQTSDTMIRDYIIKWGHEPKGNPWSPEHEVTKSVSKFAGADGYTPWQLLDRYGEGDKQSGALFQEYFQAFKGSHQLQWSRGLRALLGLTEQEPSDETLGNLEEPGEPLVSLLYDQWVYILKEDRRGELLDIASTGDRGLLDFWFAAIGLPQKVLHIDFRPWNQAQPKPPPQVPIFGQRIK
jgi:hypothetical protein